VSSQPLKRQETAADAEVRPFLTRAIDCAHALPDAGAPASAETTAGQEPYSSFLGCNI
jgi:hypothetical protein